MSLSNLVLTASLVVAFPAIFMIGVINPRSGLGVLLFFLPALNLSYRLFSVQPFPSLETIAVIVLWIGTLFHKSPSNRKAGNPSFNILAGITILIFLVTAFISSMLSKNAIDSELALKIWLTGALIPLLCFFIATRYITSWNDAKWLLYGFVGLLVQTAIFTLLAFDRRQGFMMPMDELASYLYQQSNAVVIFGNPSATISVIIMGIPLAAWYRSFGKWRPNLTAISVFTMVWAVAILSLSRGSWLGAIVATIASVPFLRKRMEFRAVIILVGLATVIYFIGGFDLITSFFNYRFSYTTTFLTAQTRLVNYQLSLQSAVNHLFLGVGLGNYAEIYREFPFSPASFSTHLWFAHSLFLTLIPEIGLIGAISFLSFFVLSIRRVLQQAKKLQDINRWFVYAVLVGVVSYLVIASTSGTHLIATLGDYLRSPALIVVYSFLGAVINYTDGVDSLDKNITIYVWH